MGLFRTIGRPILFLLPPETAHRAASLALRAPLPWRAIAGGVPEHSTRLAGVELTVPVGLAAGFDKSATMMEGLSGLGFGYLVIGTVSRHPRAGNPKPRILRDAGRHALVNAMGIPNDGVEAVAGRLEARRTPTPVFASIADEEPEDVLAVHERLAPLVQGIELNVSSPNSPWRHSGRDNAEHLRLVLDELDIAARPLFVKIPPFEPADDAAASPVLELVRIAAEHGVAGFTCANTRPVAAPSLPNGRGGLSGSPLTEATPRIVEAVRAAAPEAVVNACGGIADPGAARRCLDAGATTVQLYTALIYEGPRLVRTIARGL